MALEDVIRKIKSHRDYKKCGMVLYHNGIVRETSRAGEPVKSLKVSVDHRKLEALIERQKNSEGIFEILVEIYEGKELYPGDDVMVLAVAGDIRSNVKRALSDTLEAIKTECTSKEEVLLN